MAADTFPDVHAEATRSAQTLVSGDEPDVEPLGFTTQSFSGVFDAAFDLYKRHFGVLALIVACVFIPTQMVLYAAGNVWLKPLMAHTAGETPDPGMMLQVILIGVFVGNPTAGVPGFVSLLTSFMASGPVAVAVGNVLLGRPTTVSAAYRRAAPIFRRLFLTWILVCLLFGLALFITSMVESMIVLMFSAAVAYIPQLSPIFGSPEVILVITILGVVLMYVVGCTSTAYLFAFAPPLVALENLSIGAAVERNIRLVRGKQFRRIAISISVLPLVTFGLQVLTLWSATSLVQTLKWPAWSEFVINTGLSSVIAFFFQPYWMIFLTLLYFDQRVRKEGLDLRFMTDNLPELDPLLEPIPATAPAVGAGSVLPPPFPTTPPPIPAGYQERR